MKESWVMINEEDRCLICNRIIYKDKFITKIPEGFICYKCKKINKDSICLILNFQDFGEVLFLCVNKLFTNIYGKKLSNPIWEGYILDAYDKRFRDFYFDRLHLSLSYEKNLVKIGQL